MSAIAKAIWWVRRDFRERATALRTYPSSSAAAMTLRTVSCLVGRPLSTRDTEAIDTPARLAIVVIVGPSRTVGQLLRLRYRKRLQITCSIAVNVYGWRQSNSQGADNVKSHPDNIRRSWWGGPAAGTAGRTGAGAVAGDHDRSGPRTVAHPAGRPAGVTRRRAAPERPARRIRRAAVAATTGGSSNRPGRGRHRRARPSAEAPSRDGVPRAGFAGAEALDEAELEAFVTPDLEAHRDHPRQRAVAVALTGQRHGEQIDHALERAYGPGRGGHVVGQEQQPAGAQHTGHLPQRRRLVGDPAQRERAHHRVEPAVFEVERPRIPPPQVDRAAQPGRPPAGLGQHSLAPLHPGQPYVAGVVRQVQAGADGHLQRVARRLSAQPAPGVGEETALGEGHPPVVGSGLPVPVTH